MARQYVATSDLHAIETTFCLRVVDTIFKINCDLEFETFEEKNEDYTAL